jgi:hypothetical protein
MITRVPPIIVQIPRPLPRRPVSGRQSVTVWPGGLVRAARIVGRSGKRRAVFARPPWGTVLDSTRGAGAIPRRRLASAPMPPAKCRPPRPRYRNRRPWRLIG